MDGRLVSCWVRDMGLVAGSFEVEIDLLFFFFDFEDCGCSSETLGPTGVVSFISFSFDGPGDTAGDSSLSGSVCRSPTNDFGSSGDGVGGAFPMSCDDCLFGLGASSTTFPRL